MLRASARSMSGLSTRILRNTTCSAELLATYWRRSVASALIARDWSFSSAICAAAWVDWREIAAEVAESESSRILMNHALAPMVTMAKASSPTNAAIHGWKASDESLGNCSPRGWRAMERVSSAGVTGGPLVTRRYRAVLRLARVSKQAPK